MKKRKVYNFVTENKSTPSIPKAVDGFGYIIIPNDLSRSKYIRNVYLTGHCMILTSYNEPIREVIIPKELIQEIVFPLSSSERGSLIRYSYCQDQPCIDSIHLKPNESYMYKENTYVDERKLDGKTMSDIKSLDAGNWIISFDDKEGSDGKIIISAKGESSGSVVEIGLDGNINVKCSNSINNTAKDTIEDNSEIRSISASKSVTITVDNEVDDEDGSTIIVSPTGVSVISSNVLLGLEPTESAVLGNTIEGKLQSVIDTLDTLIRAIRLATITPADGGATFKSTIVAALTSYIKVDLDGILSENVKLK